MRFLSLTAILVAAALAFAVAATPPAASAEDAIERLGAAWREAFEKGDAEALALLFAEDAEYVSADGEVHQGREAIRKLATGFFHRFPGAKLDSKRTSLRFLAPTLAVADGKTAILDAEGTVRSRFAYTVVASRNGDQWSISSLRERAPRAEDVPPRERLEAIAWLVGDWMDDSDEARIRSTCRWSGAATGYSARPAPDPARCRSRSPP